MNKEIKKAIKNLLDLINKEQGCGVLLIYGEGDEGCLEVTSGGAGYKRIIVEAIGKSMIEHEATREIIAVALGSIDPDVLAETLNKDIKTKN